MFNEKLQKIAFFIIGGSFIFLLAIGFFRGEFGGEGSSGITITDAVSYATDQGEIVMLSSNGNVVRTLKLSSLSSSFYHPSDVISDYIILKNGISFVAVKNESINSPNPHGDYRVLKINFSGEFLAAEWSFNLDDEFVEFEFYENDLFVAQKRQVLKISSSLGLGVASFDTDQNIGSVSVYDGLVTIYRPISASVVVNRIQILDSTNLNILQEGLDRFAARTIGSLSHNEKGIFLLVQRAFSGPREISIVNPSTLEASLIFQTSFSEVDTILISNNSTLSFITDNSIIFFDIDTEETKNYILPFQTVHFDANEISFSIVANNEIFVGDNETGFSWRRSPSEGNIILTKFLR